MTRTLTALAAIAAPGVAAAAADAFLCAPEWTTETPDAHYRGIGGCIQFDAIGVLAASEPGALLGAGGTLGPLSFSTKLGLNTGLWFQQTADGTVLPAVTLYVRKPGGAQPYSVMTLSDAILVGARLSGSDEAPDVTISLVARSVSWSVWAVNASNVRIEPPVVTTWSAP